jgi:uncharacterized membrane protein YphA (DoxX/SURF4 family)
MSEVVIALGKLHAWTWVGIVIARVSVGCAFLLSGGGKLFVNERREQMRQTLRDARIPFSPVQSRFVSLVEFVFGSLLVA